MSSNTKTADAHNNGHSARTYVSSSVDKMFVNVEAVWLLS